jgi:hypothetical protein
MGLIVATGPWQEPNNDFSNVVFRDMVFPITHLFYDVCNRGVHKLSARTL